VTAQPAVAVGRARRSLPSRVRPPLNGGIVGLTWGETMTSRMAMALIGTVSVWAMAGCDSKESTDAGPRPGVCDGVPATSQAATIHVSRSTNSPELIVTVHCDGSAERALGMAGTDNNGGIMAQNYAPSSPEVLVFLTDLDAVGDVSAIPAGPANLNLQSPCAKSVSFGTVTTIDAQGKTSGDMQCLMNPTAAESALAADCRVLAPWP